MVLWTFLNLSNLLSALFSISFSNRKSSLRLHDLYVLVESVKHHSHIKMFESIHRSQKAAKRRRKRRWKRPRLARTENLKTVKADWVRIWWSDHLGSAGTSALLLFLFLTPSSVAVNQATDLRDGSNVSKVTLWLPVVTLEMHSVWKSKPELSLNILCSSILIRLNVDTHLSKL